MENHSVTYPPSYTSYLEYIESDEDFEFRLRMEHEWSDTSYQQLMAHITQVIADYRGTDLIPLPIMYFFVSGVTQILGIISHPEFLNNRSKTPGELKEYQEIVTKRKDELVDLQKKFLSGELFLKD